MKEWEEAWIIMGDFNDLRSNEKKWGGKDRAEGSFREFNRFIRANNLIDLGYQGVPWTWSNSWDGDGEVKEMLDRCLCSTEWVQRYEKARCNHGETEASDHLMLIVDTNSDTKRKKRRFYFDQRWTKNLETKEVIQGAWRKDHLGSRMFKVTRKIKECRIAILEWRKKVQGNSKVRIKELKEKLIKVREGNDGGKCGQVAELKSQLSKSYKEEELYWSQKSRSKWLKEGDRNTVFFHSTVMAKKRRNTISTLQKNDGTWCKDEQEIEEELSEYYKDLFTTTSPDNFEDILTEIPNTICSQMNEQLIRPVEENEISNSQSAFIPGRQILDNVVVAHEILHFLKNRRKGRVGYMALKLDMSKVYDRVEWKFVGRLMMEMGFCPIFVRWIMTCLSTVSYSFNLNGQKVGYIQPSRGIRQCDPLSPYLFIICAEGLSSLIHKAVAEKELTGIKYARIVRPFLTYFLQMILYYAAKQTNRSRGRSKAFWKDMAKHQDRW
ncbi:uncharacterized protein [Coffea arabica]|uniref:Reverse transcriptase domain-containing protein n=1 Tax=Coffea arabica TaxID=13443 RepID=A0ABM4W552_COFAR